MPADQNTRTCISPLGNIRGKLMTRGVVGVACMSGLSLIAAISLLWACIERGECLHRGPDACRSRMFEVRPEEPATNLNEARGPPRLGFRGNPDFYGLGIRLGIYLQWFASLIANVALDEKLRRTTNVPYIGFQIAILAALLFLIFKSDCTFAAEMFIILYILLGGIFIVLAPEIVQGFKHVLWHDRKRPRYTLFSTFAWIITGLVVPVSAWFWIRLAIMDPQHADFDSTPGGTSLFLLSHVKGKGIKVASVFMFMWSLLLGVFAIEKIVLAPIYKAMGTEVRFVLFTLVGIICRAIWYSLWLLKTAVEHVIVTCQENPEKSVCDGIYEALNLGKTITLRSMVGEARHKDLADQSELHTRLYAFIVAVVSIILSICAVELTLAWNRVSDISSVTSTGQIIPLFLGMATLVPVMWQFGMSVNSTQKINQYSCLYDLEAHMWQSAEVE